jgi:Spy/CpxP family protein refolding chaperone
MKKWKSILLLSLVFFTGVVLGVVGTRAVSRHFTQMAIAHPERMQFFIERNLTRRLGLSADQQAQLHDILTDTRGQMRTLRQEFRPKVETIFVDTDTKIDAILTPEQQARYEKIKEADHPLLRSLRQGQ